MRSKLLSISIWNLGCIGNEGLTIDLDNIICLVGQNNTGKSTVLRAYELAVGTQNYNYEKDHCKKSEENTIIEISVHIPENTGNIAEKWKVKTGDFLVVRSRWTWDENGSKSRKTYDPEISDFSEDGNAAGLDTVFNSRLPKPFRIGALENPQTELKTLLKLVLDPITESLKAKLEDKESNLSKALETFNTEARVPVLEHKPKIESYNSEITRNHNQIFPNLSVGLNIGISEIKIDPTDALLKGSKLTIKEFENDIDWEQQGTGSQRALFWSLLQVRSKLQSLKDIKSDNEKKIKELEKQIKKLEGEMKKASKDETRQAKQQLIDEAKGEIDRISKIDSQDIVSNIQEHDITLPGYMLLIDEPEIALHPNGIRAASKYLYELAKDSSWQIMLTTHSPLFINPFEDHTTIIRLSRNGEVPSPKTYRTDYIKFGYSELEQLRLLNTFEQNIAEMFFGQYPIIIEGDTEFAAFHKVIQLYPEEFPINSHPLLIRARGKMTISLIVRMLAHFKVSFSVLHDIDYPKTKKGSSNNVWSYNETIYNTIKAARNDDVKIIHRVSIYTFETQHLGVEVDEDGNVVTRGAKDKPWIMFDKTTTDEKVALSVKNVFIDLITPDSKEEPFSKDFIAGYKEEFNLWVRENKITDSRFQQ